MTREEAKELFEKASDSSLNYLDSAEAVSISQVEIILNEIYDDFENRTCENCKHTATLGKNIACNLLSYWVSNDFYCKKWESKE